jgi:hypothetical protein
VDQRVDEDVLDAQLPELLREVLRDALLLVADLRQ